MGRAVGMVGVVGMMATAAKAADMVREETQEAGATLGAMMWAVARVEETATAVEVGVVVAIAREAG